MKLMHPILNAPLDFEEGPIKRLVIENKHLYYSCVSEITNQGNDEGGEFVLSKNNDILELSKSAKIVSDFHNFELSRKEINKLLSYLETKATQEFTKELSEINRMALSITDLLLVNENQNVFYNEFSFIDFIKMMRIEVRFDESSTLVEKVVEYIRFLNEYDMADFFIICGISRYIEPEEYILICDKLISVNVSLLFVDSDSGIEPLTIESVIIDKDLCVI